MLRVSFDFGYGNIKAVTNTGEKIVFPTASKLYVGKLDQDTSTFDYIMNINEKLYAVGEFATVGDIVKRWSKEQQLNKTDLSVYLGTALYQLTQNIADYEIDVDISVGLPVDHYMSQKQELENNLKDLVIKANDKIFRIQKYIVSQQGVGAFLSLSLAVDAELKSNLDSELLEFGGGILDIGFRTVDYVKIDKKTKGFILSDTESGSFDNKGMIDAYQDCADKINSKFDSTFTALEIEEAIRDNKSNVIISRQKIDIRTYFDESCKKLADKLSNMISAKWKNINQFGAVYICGGGAAYLSPYLDLKGVSVKLQDDAIFSNCYGYLAKLALHS